jgi:D-lactate dehydrogenase
MAIASRLEPDAIAGLRAIFGDAGLLTDPSDLLPYAYDNSRRQCMPDAVVFARTADQVRELVLLCNRHRLPLVARGRGTNTTGATVPVRGGVVLSLERMGRILQIAPEDRIAVVEPGVTNAELQAAVAAHGFFWPPDPSSAGYATVGGNLACNAAGPRAVKYGTPRENTLGLQAVSGSGDWLRTGVCTTKGVVGYDLTRLIIGSEGTLAIITAATLKLTPLPAAKRTLRCLYRDMEGAARAVSNIMAQPEVPCALEFIDSAAIELVRNYSRQHGEDAGLAPGAGAMLIVEVDGSEAGIASAVSAVMAAARNPSLIEMLAAGTEAEVDAIWRARRSLSPALRSLAPKKINEDVVVPVSRMPELIAGLERLSREYKLRIVNFGHAGNGNIHVNLLGDPKDPAELEAMYRCLDAAFGLVLELGGTLSGEHGVGLEKRDFLDREIEPATLAVMRGIKRLLDPNGILNPGKLLPDQPA